MATKKYSLVLFASLAVAAIATMLVFRVISASTARNRIATLPVVVAAKDIAEGAELREADLRVEQWPEPVVPENAFEASVRVSGRVARVPIYAGEAVVPGRLAPEGATPGLEAKIAAGKRAMGVRINDVSGMNGMIQPNSRVDILLTVADGPDAPQRSMLIMEDMRVLAMGSEVTRGADGRVRPSSVAMIEVTPKESEMLAAAQAKGQIQLVLRGFSESGSSTTEKVNEKAAALLRNAPTTSASAETRTPPPTRRPTPPAATPVTAQVTAPVTAAPTPTPPVSAPVTRAESLTVQVWRGAKRSDEKLKKDSVKRDTIRP